MKIVDFNRTYIERALEIAKTSYDEEQVYVPALPKIEVLPGLEHFADNNLGVVALEGDRMLGYLGVYIPTEDHFRSTNVRGTFSPIHANGVITERLKRKSGDENNLNRDRIYSLLYQEAAKKWVKAGIRSHAIAFYTHDQDAMKSFFYNGFGLRCIDAIRSLDDLLTPIDTYPLINADIEYKEVPLAEWSLLLEYNNALISHLGDSPAFMKYDLLDEKEFDRRNSKSSRYFAATKDGRYIAYIKIDKDGENFATEVSDMMNICGAFCDPEFRGTGIYYNLLCYLMTSLKMEGYRRLGVDCESFNPTARGFWLKYFTEYTHSVVRRIDDKAITD